MVESLLEQIVSLHPIENCSAMRKSESDEHTEFLLQNAIEHSNLKAEFF